MQGRSSRFWKPLRGFSSNLLLLLRLFHLLRLHNPLPLRLRLKPRSQDCTPDQPVTSKEARQKRASNHEKAGAGPSKIPRFWHYPILLQQQRRQWALSLRRPLRLVLPMRSQLQRKYRCWCWFRSGTQRFDFRMGRATVNSSSRF
jgi:hypothetical protein